MCGICGLVQWNTTAPIDAHLLSAMNQAIAHRGPDEEGVFTTTFDGPTPGAVGLAMRRLAIIDRAHGQQPLFNEDGTIGVVYNGEIYNVTELRSELEAHGHVFKTRSDTEVLVHGYEVWGDAMPARLNGMFAFALWDQNKRRLVIGRDRSGIKPLHYAVLPDKWVFGSEIKCVLKAPFVSTAIDSLAIDDYLSHRYIPTPRTAYESIRKLEPGHLLIWENGAIHKKNYWTFSPAPPRDQGMPYYLEKLDFLLEDAVRRQMVSEVPLGTFLSGGLDSPTITYYAKKFNPDVLTFHIYFADKSFSERAEARMVADHLKTQHVEREVTADIESLIPSLVDVFDEPFGDDSAVPTFFLTKMAREKMTVALSGDGGDELLGGYPTYLADRWAGLYKAFPRFVTERMVEPLVKRLPVSHGRISWDYKAKAFVDAARRPSPWEHFGWTEIFKPEQKERLYSSDFWSQVKDRAAAENYQRAYQESVSSSREGLEHFLYVDQKTHLMDEFLVKVDRLSMAHSLEVRPPFLDHRLVEWAAEIPFHYKINGFTTKYLLRRLMKGRLPDAVIKGGKNGFAPPTSRWLAGELLPYVQKKFSPTWLQTNPFLNPEEPSRLLQTHLTKRSNLGRRLWTLLMFIEWYDRKVLKR